jgi:hypothetical protein
MVSFSKMQRVMHDFLIANASLEVAKIPKDSLDGARKVHYQEILKKYNIENEYFMKSYDYYVSNPELMDSLMKKVIDQMGEEQSKKEQERLQNARVNGIYLPPQPAK